jgi:hypothetical protein
MNPSRDPTPDEVKKIVLALWQRFPLIEERYKMAEFAMDKDEKLDLYALIVRIKSWDGET